VLPNKIVTIVLLLTYYRQGTVCSLPFKISCYYCGVAKIDSVCEL